MTEITVEAPYPVRLEIDYPERLSRLLIFVKWLLAIPHYIVLILYGIAAWLAAVAAFLIILFSGKLPEGLHEFILGFDRYSFRVGAYVGLLTDQYPPFSGEPDAAYPLRLECDYSESLSRGLVLIKWLLVIPHVIILIFYAIAAVLVSVIAWFAILFTAQYPRGLFDFVAGFYRWQARVQLYSGTYSAYNPYVGGLLTDQYPPFSNE